MTHTQPGKNLQTPGPKSPWDKEVAELITKQLRSKFTYHHVEGTPTVIGVLQGQQVYIHVENSTHVKHTLQLFQTQIEGSRMYTNTGVIILPRGKKYVNQLKHMRRLELELPPFVRQWKNGDGSINKETPVKMEAWLQEVMPQGIKEAMEALKTKLGKPKPIEEGKEIKISKICFDDTNTSAFKEIAQPVKEERWGDSMMRRGMQPAEEEQ